MPGQQEKVKAPKGRREKKGERGDERGWRREEGGGREEKVVRNR